MNTFPKFSHRYGSLERLGKHCRRRKIVRARGGSLSETVFFLIMSICLLNYLGSGAIAKYLRTVCWSSGKFWPSLIKTTNKNLLSC